VSTAFRILVVLAAIAIVLAFLLGPAWRGSFYRTWLRPRLIAIGIVVLLFVAGDYFFRLVNAVRNH
jgi:hypothetical protein